MTSRPPPRSRPPRHSQTSSNSGSRPASRPYGKDNHPACSPASALATAPYADTYPSPTAHPPSFTLLLPAYAYSMPCVVRSRILLWAAGLALLLLAAPKVPGCSATPVPSLIIPVTIGFGVAVPAALPSAWGGSFSYLTSEVFLSPILTATFDLGTYPHDFPNRFEATSALQVKAWLGPIAVFTGGGLTMHWMRVGSAWGFRPLLAFKVGAQIWPVDAVALTLQIRSLDPFPLSWTFSPELSASLAVALGPAPPPEPVLDLGTLWFVVGLGVAAAIAFLPRA